MNLTTRNLVLLGLLLTILAGVGAGTWYVLKRGSQRRDLYAGAMTNLDSGDFVRAEEKLRTVLSTDPDHVLAFTRLANLLGVQRRLDDLAELVREWTERSSKPEIGGRTHVGILVGVGEFARAEREALRLAPDDPLLIHRVRLATRSVSMNPGSLLEAADAARRVADLTDSKLERATALVQAGEILSELAADSSGDVSQRLGAEARRVFAEAFTATADAKRESGDKRVEYACDMLVARVLLRTGDADERVKSRSLIETRLEARKADFDLRVALIRSLLQRGGASGADGAPDVATLQSAAIGHARALTGPVGTARSSSAQRLVVLHALAKANRADVALELLPEYFPQGEASWRIRQLRVRLLLASGDARAEEARDLAMDIVRSENADLEVVGSLVQVFQAARRAEDAIAILELARSVKGSEILDTWLVATLANSEDDESAQRARSLAEDLGRADLSLGESAAALNQMRGDAGVLRQYLDARIESSEKSRTEHRFLRLRLNYPDAMNAEGEARASARATAAADLAAIEADSAAPFAVLEQCATIAFALEEFESVGRCIAAAAGRSEALSVMPFRLVATFESGELPEAARAAIVKGLRELGKEMPAGAFLDALAAALADGTANSDAFRAGLEELAGKPSCEVPARFLALSLASRSGDLDVVERQARALLKRLPDATELRAGLAAMFLRAERPGDVLALYPQREGLDVTGAALVARALVESGQLTEASSLLTDTIRRFPNDARAFIQLAKLISDDESREGRWLEALRILSAAPPVRVIQLERAALLLRPEVGKPDRAARIFVTLLNRNLLDRQAQSGYIEYLISGDRGTDAVAFCSFLLEPNADRVPQLREQLDGLVVSAKALEVLQRLAKEAPNAGDRAQWRVARATASEKLGRVREALLDYRHVNETTNGTVASLNNGAWILVEMVRAELESAAAGTPVTRQSAVNLETAAAWIEKALPRCADLRDEFQASVYDTAAQVYLLQEEYDLALSSIRTAVERKRDSGKYRLALARILAAAGQTDAALQELGRIIVEFKGQQSEREAVILQRKLSSE